MSRPLKWLFLLMMSSALMFGFMHQVMPVEELNFERLHIFLFNLCTGGTLLLYFSEGQAGLSIRGRFFLFFSVCFALSAFFDYSPAAMLLPWPLAVLVEQVRVRTFGRVLPYALFLGKESVSRKFHQAALLCLSLALVFSSFVVFNKEFGPWVTLDGFTLNTFYLAFSFPVSLISMAVIFALMRREPVGLIHYLKEIAFWGVNLGVIVFFLFILGHLYLPQMAIATTLFFLVLLVFLLYRHLGIRSQQKSFLTSGILFLLITAVSGTLYIFMKYSGNWSPEQLQPLLRLHAFTALYGWNLSGLTVICRQGDFPIQLHSTKVIVLHWITVLILCPLGYFFLPFAVVAVVAYLVLLGKLLFSESVPV
ncbi:MAG: hypothetical protein KKD01_02800 [Proteobacteria bacterium]|nr:hypothetical protein [Pseudomonadota bacterium]MBU1232409.1 hypothetical protein [Pseudomonadota bacterium]MBU1417196.1 hypothetical protein [Pseudomonadota bacterium]MBU1453630.1 hypothetical protein [Pseudomonadota bacterium]